MRSCPKIKPRTRGRASLLVNETPKPRRRPAASRPRSPARSCLTRPIYVDRQAPSCPYPVAAPTLDPLRCSILSAGRRHEEARQSDQQPGESATPKGHDAEGPKRPKPASNHSVGPARETELERLTRDYREERRFQRLVLGGYMSVQRVHRKLTGSTASFHGKCTEVRFSPDRRHPVALPQSMPCATTRLMRCSIQSPRNRNPAGSSRLNSGWLQRGLEAAT
jgi:hypothetical protein